MKPLSLLSFVVILLCATPQAYSQSRKVETSSPPSWITPVNINYGYNKLESQAEDGYMDIAFVKQVSLTEQASYIKKSLKIINESGIENVSEVSVSYDPTYQKLVFHDIRIIRNGSPIDKLKRAKFRILQQEEDAYMHLYDGSLTALLVLDDVRNGDIVEYSYTIKGMNPVFEGRYADFYSTAYSVPVSQLYYKLIAPAGRSIYIENSNETISPITTRKGDQKEYEWTLTNVKPVHTDDHLPSWYDVYPCVMVSEFNDWQQVRGWAAKLFPNNITIDAPLKKKIEAIKAANANNEARAAAALRFVQDEVRYLGIEMGTGTHKPANPNKIFTQRYGDCKDKSYLLVTMLQAMGISATPVLVNSSMKHTVNTYLPSPKAFDHCTVRMTVDGKQFYVDPTCTNQRGSLAAISYPDYRRGLALADSSEGLATINTTEPGMVDVKEIFSVPGMDGHATLRVITTNTGCFADDARNAFKNSSSYELQKTYKNFYASYFEKEADSIDYKDDERTGTFTVYEYYSIDDLWEMEDGVKKSYFSAFVINSYLKRPKDKSRSMPMSLYFPAKYREEVLVNLPEDWNISDFDREVKCGSFIYKGSSRLVGKKLKMVFEFQTLKDFVAPSEMNELLANYKEVDDNMGWTLSYNSNTSTSVAASTTTPISTDTEKNIFIRLIVFFAFLIGAIVFLVARRKKQSQYNDLSQFGRDKWR